MTVERLHVRCETCLYWNRRGAALAAAIRDPSIGVDLGTCEASPPMVVPGAIVDEFCPIGNGIAMFPVTHANRACGMWTGYEDEPDDPARKELPTADIISLRDAA